MSSDVLIGSDGAADFLSEAANASAKELDTLLQAALAGDDSDATAAAVVLVAAACGYETNDADIHEVLAQGHLRTDEPVRQAALVALDSIEGQIRSIRAALQD